MDLLSFEFFALATTAAVVLTSAPPAQRTLLFLAVNLYFVASYLNPIGMFSTALFCLMGYAFARWAERDRRAVWVGVATLTTTFVWLRGYGVVTSLLPEAPFQELLATTGLSFLFFKIVHVVVDSGAGSLGRLPLTTYLNYCLNFTAFIVGPIQRYPDFVEQWRGERRPLPAEFEAHLDAFIRLLRGLIKKFALSPFLLPYALSSSYDIGSATPFELLASTYAFYLYLYLDFSGYCDIMIGIGSLMGIRPPENFNFPFLSRNVNEFWLRVHRSLTVWLTEYVFTPCFAALLRRKVTPRRSFATVALCLMTTLLVSGLWHGTTLSFLCFGLFHGLLLVSVEAYDRCMVRIMGRKRFARWSKHPLVHACAIVLTFNVTSLAYAFFVLDIEGVLHFARVLAGS